MLVRIFYACILSSIIHDRLTKFIAIRVTIKIYTNGVKTNEKSNNYTYICIEKSRWSIHNIIYRMVTQDLYILLVAFVYVECIYSRKKKTFGIFTTYFNLTAFISTTAHQKRIVGIIIFFHYSYII